MFNSKTEKALIWSSNIDQHCTGHCESKIAKLAVVIINRLFCERTRNLVISESLSSIILFGFLYFESSIKPSAFTALKHSKYPMISEFNKIRPINLSGGCLGYSLVYTSVGEKCIRLITCLTHSDVPNCFSAPSQRSKIHFSPRRSKLELLICIDVFMRSMSTILLVIFVIILAVDCWRSAMEIQWRCNGDAMDISHWSSLEFVYLLVLIRTF